MVVKTKIEMEKILAIQKKLQKLPQKETGKSRKEAMELLAEDFYQALQKGYSIKELRAIVAHEGVTLALSKLIEKGK